MSQPLVSVVVPAYNCEKTIGECLYAIVNQLYRPVEIIVVDDGSTDQTAKIIQGISEVKYFHQPNAGPASARNQGAREARGEFIFFTDSDCVPHLNWIEQAVKHFSRAKVAVVAGSYDIANPQNLLAQCIHQEILFRHNFLMPEFPKSFGSYNFGVRKKIFEEIGGFDTAYRYASGEDNDLSYKVIQAGYKIYFEKNARVKHYHTTKVGKYLQEQYRHGFWRVKIYADHPYMVRGDDYTFWKDIVELPLAYLIILGGLSVAFVNPFLQKLILLTMVGLWILELVFAAAIIKIFFGSLFYSGVLFLRALARALGFSSGLLYFLFKNNYKKYK